MEREFKRQKGRKPVRQADLKRNIKTQKALGYSSAELKWHDTSHYSQTIVTTTDMTGMVIHPGGTNTLCLNSINQGNSAKSRIGSKILITSIWIRGVITVSAHDDFDAFDTAPNVFIALVQQKESRGLIPNTGRVWENPTNQIRMSVVPLRNLNYSEEFNVLRQQTIETNRYLRQVSHGKGSTAGTADTVQSPAYDIPFQMKWTGQIPTKYLALNNTDDIAAIIDNALHLTACCSDNTRNPQIAWHCRIRYLD